MTNSRIFLTLAIFTVWIGFTGTSQLLAQNTPPPQGAEAMTGGKLYSLIRAGGNSGYGLAARFIRDTYARELNDGVFPDWGTVWGLAQIFLKYMDGHKSRWDEPSKALLVDALKDAPARIRKEQAYWDDVNKVAATYFSAPTPQNAKKLYSALPEEGVSFLDAEAENALVLYIMDFTHGGRRKNLSILEEHIEAGEPHAVDVAFRLLHLTDGGIAETLLYIIGRLVDNHPRLFLQKYLFHSRQKGSSISKTLDSMMLMVAEWGEIPEAGNDQAKYDQIRSSRLERRIKALESVEDPELKEIRDRCVSIIRKKGTTRISFRE